MATDTITLILEGDIPLESFAKAIKDFSSLIVALTNEEGGDIEWTIEDLQPGSTLATVRGRSPQPERVERVVRNYARVGKALQRNQSVSHSLKVARPAQALGRLVGEKVKTIRFETPEEEAVISKRPSSRRTLTVEDTMTVPEPQIESAPGSFGAVEGEVQTLSKRHGLRFTLYDSLNDRAVSCYLQPGQEESMRDVWGKHAIIEGWISRDPTDGRPLAVRHVSDITPILEEGDYTQARGILPLKPGDELPEVRIRQLRDG